MHEASFVADLGIVLGVAAVTGVMARRLSQPTILGYLTAGLIIGPYIPIPVFADPERVDALAEFGVVLVMFAIGLEFRVARMLRVLPAAGLTVLVEVALLIWAGFTVGQWLGWSSVASLFLGACIGISSTMVVSKVYDQQPVAADVRDHVLSILVVQDVAAIGLIAAMTAVAAGEGLAPREVAWTLAGLAGVLTAMLVGGMLVVPRAIGAVSRMGSSEILVVVSIGLCFVIALLAEELGYSVALGAFIAGILVAESGRGSRVEELIAPVRDMFAAVFFVSVGMTVDPRLALGQLPAILLVAAVVAAVQLASVASAGILSGRGLRRSVMAGLSLGQVGEFGFIIAAIGVEAGAAPDSLQSVVVGVAVLTALTTPLSMRASDRVVGFVDRAMPARLQHLLGLYESWLERFRGSGAETAARPVPRAVWVLALDAAVLVATLALTISWAGVAAGALASRLTLEPGLAFGLVLAAVAVASTPFLVSLIRNTRALARTVTEPLPSPEDGAPVGAGATLAARLLRWMIYLGVVLGVGMPAVALLRPLTVRGYGIWLLGALLLAIGTALWRAAGAMDREFHSGVERIARALAAGADADAGPDVGGEGSLLPGLDDVARLEIDGSAHCVGRTLAELDLRARTGATVIAIHRGDADVILPTGREHLEVGDELAITGAGAALQRARDLLVGGVAPGVSPRAAPTSVGSPPSPVE